MAEQRIRLQPNPYSAARALAVIARLFAALFATALAAWPFSLLWGDRALMVAVMGMPVVSGVVVLRQQRRQAREDAIPLELLFDGAQLCLRLGRAPAVTLARGAIKALPGLYFAGGRTVTRMPAVELELERRRLVVFLPDPRQTWPERHLERCGAAPTYQVVAEDWPALLAALELPPTRATA